MLKVDIAAVIDTNSGIAGIPILYTNSISKYSVVELTVEC